MRIWELGDKVENSCTETRGQQAKQAKAWVVNGHSALEGW